MNRVLRVVFICMYVSLFLSLLLACFLLIPVHSQVKKRYLNRHPPALSALSWFKPVVSFDYRGATEFLPSQSGLDIVANFLGLSEDMSNNSASGLVSLQKSVKQLRNEAGIRRIKVSKRKKIPQRLEIFANRVWLDRLVDPVRTSCYFV